MKVKLLRKVRKNFRIVQNGLYRQELQERTLFWWRAIDDWTMKYINYHYNITIVLHPKVLLLAILRYRYKEFFRQYKVQKVKKNHWVKIWYNK